ncbi:MAG TPA: tRNA (adenosine(37)-N6)-threonylcarbamoyltransferase complex transferase subunit TsaD [Bacteroidales bacterium]|nr:tRNA (adenosine(37)-N6)-threonylcarbamoyltransferase complex transferase subunit TsaD [Bacteroidales bacterium]
MSVTILGIESSCDDTSAAIICDQQLLSNVISSQEVHRQYGGVVPELASRAHQANIIPVVDAALRDAGLPISQIDAIAYTRGPGLLGSLLVGASFAKGVAIALGVPIISVNHLQGHVLSHFIKDEPNAVHPSFPFLCLLVSGGHTQIVLVRSPVEMEVVGQTIDDAAGEAFDKCAKVLGLPYPGGPQIDRLASTGNPKFIEFAKPKIPNLDFSFSGLKTSFLYTLRDRLNENSDFINEHLPDICASLQQTIIGILLDKVEQAVRKYSINEVAIAGGVAANSGLRSALMALGQKKGWRVYLPKKQFTTDNAAMIAIVGYYSYLLGKTSPLDEPPLARFPLG